VNSAASVGLLVPPTVFVVTKAAPLPAGVRATQEVVVVHVTEVPGVAPKSTVVEPVTNPVPAMVTWVPPEVGPDVGEIEVTVGAG
jgi:hypothetical protein